MFELPYEDFRAEIEAELFGYEEIEPPMVERFLNEIDQFVGKQKKSANVVYRGKEVLVKLKDEADLFMMVDKYLAAVVAEEVDQYFQDFKI